jgi:SsrA-binding protein
MKIIVENKKAKMAYIPTERFLAGIQLFGHEVKMLRNGRGSLVGSHVRILNHEAFLLNAQIPLYPFARDDEYEPARTRKLLLHKKELLKLEEAQSTKGLALIPWVIGLDKNLLKVEVVIAKGKKLYERKEELKQRDIARDTEKEMKRRGK